MKPEIATLVGSRICHDLISPIGAIGNGVELLELTNGDTTNEVALISDSVENANARIRFFRIAYGAASPDQTINQSEVVSILTAVSKSQRHSYVWSAEGDQPRTLVRAAFLLLQCLETALPMGGEIHVTTNGPNWTLKATADRLNLDAALWQILTSPSDSPDIKASQVQFALAPIAIEEVGRALKLETSDHAITVTF